MKRRDDFLYVIFDNDRLIGKSTGARTPFFTRVIGDRRIGILEPVAGDNTDDAVAGRDHSLRAQPLRAGNRGAAGGLASKASGPNLRLAVENLLVRDFADDAVANLERAQAFDEIHRAVDLNRGRESGGPP